MKDGATLVSLEEYLNTSYEPDRDYVDGVLVERNVGTQKHGGLQFIVAKYFDRFQKSHGIHTFIEVRLLVNAATGRHRIPDVQVLQIPFKRDRVVVDVPVVIVEIKSPEDTLDDLLDRCFDYEKLAVKNILVMDPDRKLAWTFEQGSLKLLTGASAELDLGQSILAFPFAQLFAELDE
jgi:Uma2 family endonuclease